MAEPMRFKLVKEILPLESWLTPEQEAVLFEKVRREMEARPNG